MKVFICLSIVIPAFFLQAVAQGLWTQKADFGGVARTGAAGFSIGNKGYIGTGVNSSGTKLNDFWEYDPETNAWTQKANATFTGRSNATSFTLEGKGYLVGGYTTSFTKNLLEYDPATNEWNYRANFLGVGRSDGVAFNISAGVLFGTGISSTGYRKDFYLYSPPPFDSWAQLAPLPGNERMDAVGFNIDGKGYIGTGDGGGTQLNDWWEYTLPDNIWTQKATLTGGQRYEAAGFVIGSKGYVACGYYSGNLNNCFEYNPATNSWREVAVFPGGGRRSAVGFSIGNYGYMGTGYDGTASRKDFWQYDPTDPEISLSQGNTSISDNSGSYNFGSQSLNSSANVTFTIQNSGARALRLSSNPRVTVNGAGFSLSSDAPDIIPPNSSGTFVVSFNPQTCGARSGSISIANDDADENPFNFTISGTGLDNVPPALPPLPIIKRQCSATVTAPLTTDNCSGSVTGTTSSPLSYNAQGAYTINWSFTDGAGNTSIGVQTILVDDTISPSLTCSLNQTMNLPEGQSFYTVQGTEFDPLSSFDNCGFLNINNNLNNQASLAGFQLPVGNNNLVWQATDIGGNTESCSLQVQVNSFTSIADAVVNGIHLHPNPVRDELLVNLEGKIIEKLTITDINGKVLLEKASVHNGEILRLAALTPGMYLLKMEIGNATQVRKIVKE